MTNYEQYIRNRVEFALGYLPEDSPAAMSLNEVLEYQNRHILTDAGIWMYSDIRATIEDMGKPLFSQEQLQEVAEHLRDLDSRNPSWDNLQAAVTRVWEAA